jgi:molecular chaperone DnaK
VEIDVYQGEHDDVRQNHRVSRFRIQGLAPMPAGNQITVQLDLNLDGVLEVTARARATGLQKAITNENALAEFERAERESARRRLMDLGEDSEEGSWDASAEVVEGEAASGTEEMPDLVPGPREGQREAVQARALLEKAERLLDKVSAEDRGELERLMERIRTALTDRRWEQVTSASNELADVLFYLEDS